MSLLVIGRGWTPERIGLDRDATRARAEASRQGFAAPVALHWANGGAWWFATPNNRRGSGAALRRGERFAAYVGSVHWRGRTGHALLEHLIDVNRPPRDLPLDDFGGAFAMLLGVDSGIWLFNDVLGLQRMYEGAGGCWISSSLLLGRAIQDRVDIDRLRAQEYVLLGANHGLNTPIQGLTIFPPTCTRELVSGRVIELHPPQRLRARCAFGTRAEAAHSIAQTLTAIGEDCVNAFGADIGMALSGGFDSRLLLALLDRIGIAPQLYVYGTSSDSDVRVAAAVAAGLGLQLECTDKASLDADAPPLDLPTLQNRVAFFDGLPVDGVFDLGSDRATRLRQVAQGRLNLNGGGGEILRNFFSLRDRSYTAAELVGAFYSNWRTDAFRDVEERRAFTDMLRDAVLECLGFEPGDKRPLARADVELVYALLRLRYWMGRNNSVAARYGAFLTPLADARLVRLCAPLPLAWKNYGTLESEVITRLSPRVARGPSAYDFDFSKGPDAKHRARVAMTLYRPLPIRSRSAVLKRWLGRSQTAPMPTRWRDLAAELPAQDWVNAAALTEADQLNRLLSLQALLSPRHCGVTIDSDIGSAPKTGPVA